jgi:two-component system LytT family response regulator
MRDIRAVIADDEPLARRGIRQLLELHTDVHIVGECRDGREALRALQTLSADLIFLDVQMPELDGFGVLRAHGPERMPAVVFLTAYDEFAVQAFEAHAIDYLVKPVSDARFAAALDRVREHMRSADALELARRLGALLQTQAAANELGNGGETPCMRRLLVPTPSGDLLLDVAEIDWIQAEDYYAAVHARGKRHLIRESLSMLETRLDRTRFVRVHRSAIVSIDRVREMRTAHGESVLVLRDGTRVPVSRRRREQVAAMVKQWAR